MGNSYGCNLRILVSIRDIISGMGGLERAALFFLGNSWHCRAMDLTRVHMPSEQVALSSLWVGWPYLQSEWGSALDGARQEISDFVRAARRFVPVVVAVGSDDAEKSARSMLPSENVNFCRIPMGDIWLRDTGAIIAEKNGASVALTFQFNGWGQKYIMSGDTETASAMAAELGLVEVRRDFVLEGGAVEFDGAGRCITSRSCLLNPNRKSEWTEAVAEAALMKVFNVDTVIWLDDGLLNDHTDGHVDNLARFIAPGRVLCQHMSRSDDPNADIYARIEKELAAAGLDVVTIPSPDIISDANGVEMPASHLNFVFLPGAIIFPVYDVRLSVLAQKRLEGIFPDREIIALPSRNILSGGGSFHCMTREIPSFPIQEF